ncbi:MAG: flagellar hook basal-body protein [Oscillibacter sp.]|nr:flagellar hook basal-body protein [Oscillibacter sp.]
MDTSFYTAAVGAQYQQDRLNVHGNNIANVNNYGFRARRTSFSALMGNQMRGIEQDYQRHVGARLESTEGLYWGNQAGVSLTPTYRALDYAIEGSGFFALQDPASGEISYTRDGSFILSSLVVTEQERMALTEEEQIDFEAAVEAAQMAGEEPPEWPMEDVQRTRWYLSDGMGRFVLSREGQRIMVEHPDEVAMGKEHPVGVFDFLNHNGMVSLGDNRFAPVDKNGGVGLQQEGKVLQGFLENSSTDLAYEFAKVIETQRTFTYLLKMVQTSDEITQSVNGLR